MAKNKTNFTEENVSDFIHSFVENDQKKADSFELIKLLKEWSGFEPHMFGPSIIGFGKYQYQYASGHGGEAPILGFSPRKNAISLYVYSETEKNKIHLEDLGKYKMGKACIYVKKLTDIDISILEKMSRETLNFIKHNYESSIKS